ncbi:DUF3896 family protein [Bacillus sp. RIT 809]|uniref:DUF3896 family protein n=1 Tax=Bacillus sp. RIT 809 TaxID=2803857 RepID=UPI00194ED03A|nr:DUF3896 family protein [Bacillus sp. RIT 809]MBM6644986.1 DUF3896 family protein [Bacillus sp. RIT 809]
MKHTYDYHTTKKHLELKKEQLCNKLSSMKLSEKEREQLKLEIDNYEYILNLVEMNHYERGFSR